MRQRVLRAAGAHPDALLDATASKKAIVAFVERVTRAGSPEFVPVAERIATFDNDGTLWAERPVYVQAAFALDRVKALAPQHPEWKHTEPFASLLEGDLKGAFADGEPAIAQIVMHTHAGMTTDEFHAIVSDWIATARRRRSTCAMASLSSCDCPR